MLELQVSYICNVDTTYFLGKCFLLICKLSICKTLEWIIESPKIIEE